LWFAMDGALCEKEEGVSHISSTASEEAEEKIEIIIDAMTGQYSLHLGISEKIHEALMESYPFLRQVPLEVTFGGDQILEADTVEDWGMEDGAHISVQVSCPEGFFTFSSTRCHKANILLQDGATVKKNDGHGDGDIADYSTTLGEAVVEAGKHQWDLEILNVRGNMRLGVAVPDLIIGCEDTPSRTWQFPHGDKDRAWFIRSVGNASDRRNLAAGEEFSTKETVDTGDVIGIAVDLDEGSIVFWKNGQQMCEPQRNLQGPICLMVCMDYGQEMVRIRKPDQVYF